MTLLSNHISFTCLGCSPRCQIDHKLGRKRRQPNSYRRSLTSVQVNSGCIIPVNHLHLEFREGRQQGGGGIGWDQAEGGLVSVRVHHSLRVDPEPRPAHISLVLSEHHLGRPFVKQVETNTQLEIPFESHHEVHQEHRQMSRSFLLEKNDFRLIQMWMTSTHGIHLPSNSGIGKANSVINCRSNCCRVVLQSVHNILVSIT